MAQACGIADELCATAHEGIDRVNWLGIEPADGSDWSLAPLGAGLGDGYTGVAVFLQAAHRVSGIQRYAEVAALALSGLPGLLAEWTEDDKAAAEIGGGAVNGLGGIAWAMAHLSHPLGGADPLVAPRLLEQTLVLCERLVERSTAPARGSWPVAAPADVATGLAGLTVALRSVARSAARPDLASRAARTASLAAALLSPVEPGRVGGGALYGAAAATWAWHLPPPAAEPAFDGDISWCSGLSGRLSVLDVSADDAERGIGLIERLGPLSDHAPCHGELGVPKHC